MIRIANVNLPLDYEKKGLEGPVARALMIAPERVLSVRIAKKSVDARDKERLHFTMTLDARVKGDIPVLPRGAERLEREEPPTLPAATIPAQRPIVVGLGPAGLFAALTLAKMGLRPIVLERGRRVDEREGDVQRYWAGGELDENSNVQFGEGGAGAFSDGKLNTGIKDPFCRVVLREMYECGAPEEILYEARPHVGTDNLKKMVKGLRGRILSAGGEIFFQSRLVRIETQDGRVAAAVVCDADGAERVIATETIILAVGHSARDTFRMLLESGVQMERKPFSLGARIEHRQKMVNQAQYGRSYLHPALGAADYRLSTHLASGRGVYTFCMCPGGTVVASASERNAIVTNGMSVFARDGVNANSALLVGVEPEDFGGDDPLAGVRFQQKWEEAAYRLGAGRAPAQLVGDFLRGAASTGAREVQPSYQPGVTWTDLAGCLPDYVIASMREAIRQFDRKLHGFAAPGAVLTGVETRSSSPVRILRGQDFMANIAGLYPCGEGAGYAGGILSAAVDGIRCAMALAGGGKEA